ncbi:unnamed protein product [Caenorhabditis angaria]|uniref:Uncharacterized protein n=1 Tax=Caenorhabditis angaria TaxID=860376 RepID=A0A9P1IAU4_9PELO|nr:unnamed protein product [Caenorhabditis angaria]
MEPETKKVKLDDDPEPTGWFDMPYEMREIVINHMSLQAKGMFAQISQQCLEEVQLSNNLNAFCLEIEDIGSKKYDNICIDITTDDNSLELFTVCNTSMAPEYEKTLANFRIAGKVFGVDSREKMREFILQNFRGLWMILKSSLRQLMIEMDDFPYDQMKLGNLNGLDTIHLSANTKNNQIDPIRSGFIDIEQLRLVKLKIFLPSPTIDQIFQLTAESIEVGYDGGELYDLDQIIDRIINEELDENVSYITIRPKQCVDKISGICAKKTIWSSTEMFLVKRMDKAVKITDFPFGLEIQTEVWTGIDERNIWPIS